VARPTHSIAFGVVALAGLLVAIAVIKRSFTTRKTKTPTARSEAWSSLDAPTSGAGANDPNKETQ